MPKVGELLLNLLLSLQRLLFDFLRNVFRRVYHVVHTGDDREV